MQTLKYKGEVVGQFYTKAEALVYCFGNGLVFDRFSPKRNQLLPDVTIVGEDQEDDGSLGLVASLPIEDRRDNISVDSNRVVSSPKRGKNHSSSSSDGGQREQVLPKRGPLDDRRSYPSERSEKHVTRRWWK